MNSRQLIEDEDVKDELLVTPPDWLPSEETKDRHGRVSILFTHKSGLVSFRLTNTLYGNRTFWPDMLQDWCAYVYGKHFIDGCGGIIAPDLAAAFEEALPEVRRTVLNHSTLLWQKVFHEQVEEEA
jgi:hypothetical protein